MTATAHVEGVDVAEETPQQSTSRRTSWLLTLLVAAAAGVLRLFRLDQPPGTVFDEVYYATDAWSLLQHGVEVADDGTPAFIAHPPLGKWMIALGEAALGNNEWGWRISAAVIGTVSVAILVRTALRLFGSLAMGLLAGVLLAVDGLHLVQSRVAMLDIFLSFWVLAAFACLLLDRDRVGSRTRWWLLAASLCLGAAIATKWSGIWFVLAFAVLFLMWEIPRRLDGAENRGRALAGILPGWLAIFAALPAAVYVASWAGWFAADESTAWGRDGAANAPGFLGWLPASLRALAVYHEQILGFHTSLGDEGHNYASHPSGWLPLARPVLYEFETSAGCGSECVTAVHALGTPLLWWGFLISLPFVLWATVLRRDRTALVILVGALAGLLPWFFMPDRPMFQFYALPSLPFLVMGTVLALRWAIGPPDGSLRRRRVVGTIGGIYVLAVILNLAYMYPILTGMEIPYEAWQDRMWLDSWV